MENNQGLDRNIQHREIPKLKFSEPDVYKKEEKIKFNKQEVLAQKWIDLINCADYLPEFFFPHKGDIDAQNIAKAVCNECVVQEACLDFALYNNIKHGIFGGKTYEERKKMKKKTS
ncbi:MAG: hypothetical protein NVSMB46_03820 [Candidatus Saccharimonadales bacterium]